MSVFSRGCSAFFLALLLLSVDSSMAASPVSRNDRRVSNDGFEEEENKPWVEGEVQFPDFPELENLIPFRVGAVDDIQYAIDSKSLSVTNDGVVRFTLVVTSSAGAQSISYEGIRCGTGERRYYASGRSDKTWSNARNSQWVKIKAVSNSHHLELFSNYFCVFGKSPVFSAEEAIRALRSGGNSRSSR